MAGQAESARPLRQPATLPDTNTDDHYDPVEESKGWSRNYGRHIGEPAGAAPERIVADRAATLPEAYQYTYRLSELSTKDRVSLEQGFGGAFNRVEGDNVVFGIAPEDQAAIAQARGDAAKQATLYNQSRIALANEMGVSLAPTVANAWQLGLYGESTGQL
ncbi:hypothetical protein HNQ59_003969 [Chitinivorax tropicus]|uniref:Uncharacterized protein n=1 Tax=Chitinivorax tropicus TaxID=714531 RepID=A0A840MND8_9PROT|nr:hypothetical protein [Chitinivorax tropicus]MBB5020644.1 hypothetical protein [Chitinivorax tropicus]